MEKKEYHRANLPHYQQLGQSYFVTWSLKDAIPAKALKDYSEQLASLRLHIETSKRDNNSLLFAELNSAYYILRKKMMKAYEDLLHLNNKTIVDLSSTDNLKIVIDALIFWQDKKLRNYAICVMTNHVHWVFEIFKKDNNGKAVYLEDIMKSVKQFSATEINKLSGNQGSLWHKESWDTTIRDNRHLYEAIEYTKNNPVKAGLVTDWRAWEGTVIFD